MGGKLFWMTTKGRSKSALPELCFYVYLLDILSSRYSLFIKHLLCSSYVLLEVEDIMVSKT